VLGCRSPFLRGLWVMLGCPSSGVGVCFGGVPHSGGAQPGHAGGHRCPMSPVLPLSEGFGVLLGGWSPPLIFGVSSGGLGVPHGIWGPWVTFGVLRILGVNWAGGGLALGRGECWGVGVQVPLLGGSLGHAGVSQQWGGGVFWGGPPFWGGSAWPCGTTSSSCIPGCRCLRGLGRCWGTGAPPWHLGSPGGI